MPGRGSEAELDELLASLEAALAQFAEIAASLDGESAEDRSEVVGSSETRS
jgi:hypothetical protein